MDKAQTGSQSGEKKAKQEPGLCPPCAKGPPPWGRQIPATIELQRAGQAYREEMKQNPFHFITGTNVFVIQIAW